MQNHSGEHVLSGIAHALFGVNNVGFHLDDTGVTLDYDRELDTKELLRLEDSANEAVFRNLPVMTFFPEPPQLLSMEYRSKKELSGDVRIVRIGDIDTCACCAPHVSRTGEIGLIRITGSMRHRGGVRLSMLAGFLALEDYRRKGESISAVSRLLSAKPGETPAAVKRVLSELEQAKQGVAAKNRELTAAKAASLRPTGGNICLFEHEADMAALRELVNAGTALCGGSAPPFPAVTSPAINISSAAGISTCRPRRVN
jgi:alanyl-tRNA synthetase